MFGFLKKLFGTQTPPPQTDPSPAAAPSEVGVYYYRIRDVASGPYHDLPEEAQQEPNREDFAIRCQPGPAGSANDRLDLTEIPDALGRLVEPNQVVVKKGAINLLIDFPLSRVAVADVVTDRPEGFTMAALLAAVQEVYVEIYDREARSQSEPTPPMHARGRLMARPESDGEFGIGAHDMEELGVIGLVVSHSDAGIWVRVETVA